MSGAGGERAEGDVRLREDGSFWLAVLAGLVVVFMLRTTYITMDDVTNGEYGTLGLRTFLEATGALAAIPALVIAVVAARLAPVPPSDGRGWGRTLLLHATAFAIGTTIHTALMAALRGGIAPLAGFEGYRYGALHLRILMEAPNDVFFYVGMVAARRMVDSRRRHRARERRALELERELARSRLENLQLQLQPHFLFNALNTISQVMYDDPRAADEMIEHLSALLRHALGRAGRAEVALTEELHLLESYLALARARFRERLDVTVEVSDDVVRHAAVPPLLLQPLVENAIQHGITPAGEGKVVIRIAELEGRLSLVVENRVPAAVPTPSATHGGVATRETIAASRDTSRRGTGVGLTVTGRRLALLYGDRASLRAGPMEPEGYRVEVTIPLHAVASSVATGGPTDAAG